MTENPTPAAAVAATAATLSPDLRERIEQKCLRIDMLTLMLNLCINYMGSDFKDIDGYPPCMGTGHYGHSVRPTAAADLAERELRLQHFDLLTLLEQVPSAEMDWYWLDCLPNKDYRRHLGYELRRDPATGREDYVHLATGTTLKPNYRLDL